MRFNGAHFASRFTGELTLNYARKMLDWGDKVIGFEQEQQLNDMIKATVTARFHSLTDGNVEIHFGSTVHYGGGVQHVAEGSLVLEARDAQALAAALAPPVVLVANAVSVLASLPDPRNQIIDLVKNMPDPETPAAIPWMRSLKRLAKGIE